MFVGEDGSAWRIGCLICCSLALLFARPAAAEDSDRIRYYLDVRYGESNPAVRAHDVAGLSLGVNLDRYLGLEIALDRYQLRLETSAGGRVADLGIDGFTPQARLRYPLFGDRLTPYLVGGMGVAHTGINDETGPVTWTSGSATRAVSTFGAGIEYFLRDNIAFGIEGKYFLMGKGSFSAAGEQRSISLNTGTITFGFRLFYPELHPLEPGTAPAGSARWRLYGALRAGGAVPQTTHLFQGISTEPAESVFDSRFTLVLGGALGFDYGRYLGLEASFENYGLTLTAASRGVIGKYAVFPILLQARLRYPVLDGLVEPYLLLGAGAEVAEPDKPNDNAHGISLSRSACAAGAVGLGIQYYVMSDVAVALETKYVITGGHDRAPDVDDVGDTNALFVTIGLRAYLFDF